MATKIPTTELKVGMFVADLDRPWVDTPFLLQGFLIEDAEQIRALMQHCQYVMVDRTRSTGDEYEAPAAAAIAAASAAATPRSVPPAAGAPRPAARVSVTTPRESNRPRIAAGSADAGDGLLGRITSGFK